MSLPDESGRKLPSNLSSVTITPISSSKSHQEFVKSPNKGGVHPNAAIPPFKSPDQGEAPIKEVIDLVNNPPILPKPQAQPFLPANLSSSAFTPDSTLIGKKKGWPRGRKRRNLPKDAPKPPLSGYMIFSTARRKALCSSENPPSFSELAKISSQHWAMLGAEEKKKYLELAEEEKERYNKEMGEYTKSSSYQSFMEQQNSGFDSNSMEGAQKSRSLPNSTDSDPLSIPSNRLKPNQSNPVKMTDSNRKNGRDADVKYSEMKRLKTDPPAPPLPTPKDTPNSSGAPRQDKSEVEDDEMVNYDESNLEIPIFTDQFLRHNKARETELRQLRKASTDYEEQNALLAKTIETMRHSMNKCTAETEELQRKHSSLSLHLSGLRADLTRAFRGNLAGYDVEPPTLDTIDDFLTSLHSRITASPPTSCNPSLQLCVQQIVTGLCSTNH